MKKTLITSLLFVIFLSGIAVTESFSSTPKKKSSLEKRMKKQNKKKKKKGDTTCPKIDC
jgi:hypothetical protein